MNKEEIILRISIARNKANLSARALSQRIGMNNGYINRLETKKDFLPSLEVLLSIIEECGLTTEEFFYYNMEEYKKDIGIINMLKKIPQKEKEAFITLLNRN